jgi:hypothetical protein
LYLLEYKTRERYDVRTLEHFGLVSDEAACLPVPSTLDSNFLRICPLRRAR